MPIKRPSVYKMYNDEIVTMSQEVVKIVKEKAPATEENIQSIATQISQNNDKILVLDGSKSGSKTKGINNLKLQRNKEFENFTRAVDGMSNHADDEMNKAANDVLGVLDANRKTEGSSYAASTYQIKSVMAALDAYKQQLQTLKLATSVDKMKSMGQELDQLRNDRATDDEVTPGDELAKLLRENRKLLTGLFGSLNSIELVNSEKIKPVIDAINAITVLYGAQVKSKETRKKNAKENGTIKKAVKNKKATGSVEGNESMEYKVEEATSKTDSSTVRTTEVEQKLSSADSTGTQVEKAESKEDQLVTAMAS